MPNIQEQVKDYLKIEQKAHQRAYDLVIVRNPDSVSLLFPDMATTYKSNGELGFIVEFTEQNCGYCGDTFKVRITFDDLDKSDADWKQYVEQERQEVKSTKLRQELFAKQAKVCADLRLLDKLKKEYEQQ
jgi:hypothetical protein